MKTKFFIGCLSLMLMLGLAACYSLAEDVTPPPGYQYPTAPASLPTEGPNYPLMPPNPAAGKVIFEEKCQPCHGANGLGNGPQASELPNPVAPIGDPEFARQAIPANWYRTVTQGNIERYMPPFNSLTERQRWDVLAYVYTLSSSPEMAATGEQLFQENCSACHGADGKGDGTETSELAINPGDFTDQKKMVSLSDESLFSGLDHPNVDELPNFDTQLNEAERWALVGYVRTLSFARTEVPVAQEDDSETTGNAQDPESASEGAEVEASEVSDTTSETPHVISGQVSNASEGGLLEGLDVVVYGFDHVDQVFSYTVKTEADGTFTFEEVTAEEGLAYIASVDYGDVTFTSDIVLFEPGMETVFLPIEMFETTTDTTNLMVDRLHVFFDFVSDDVIRVAELYVISNLGENVVIATEQDNPVIQFELPEEAFNLQFQEGSLGGRFVETTKGFGDTQAIYPGVGQHQVLYTYDLPYDSRLNLSHPVSLPVGAVVAMVPDDGVKIRNEEFVDEGTRDFQGIPYRLYMAGGLPTNGTLNVNLAGRLGEESVLSLGGDGGLETAMGIGALGLSLTAAGVWLYRRRNDNQVEEIGEEWVEEDDLLAAVVNGDMGNLMDAIIALDDGYAAGELPEKAYLERRAELKTCLKEVLDRKGNE